MGLLQKALRESTGSPEGGASSLYARAIASVPGAPEAKGRRVPEGAQAPRPASLSFGPDELRSLEADLASIAPTHDAYLAAWSKATSSLGLSSIALFMPRGESLVPAARIGFPSGATASAPIAVAELAQGGRESLDRASAEALSAALGASPALPLRASAFHSGSRLAALWVYRDLALEAAPRELQARVGSVLSSISSRGFPLVPILSPTNMPRRILLDSASKSARASIFLFDLSRLYEETSASCPGASPELLVSSFACACSATLSGEGLSVICDTMRVACVLGSSSSCDHELALFQFGKSLRRFLPFLSVATFPAGRSISIEPSSPAASSEIDKILAC